MYRNSLGVTITMMGLVSPEWIVDCRLLTLYPIVILIFMYVGFGILYIFDKNLKAIVRRVDKVELLRQQ